MMDRRRWKGWRRALYQPYKVLVMASAMTISTLIGGTAVLLLLPFLSARTVSRLCGRTWSRFNAFLTRMRVDVIGRANLDPNASYVIVSNHQSHYDVFVLYGWLETDFKWVMKKELRKIPALGIGCEKLGHIFIDRSNHQAAIASIQSARDQIRNGTSVIFFPEGTRSRDGRLRPFKKGAFRMALDLGLPILPVTIVGTRDILPPHSRDLMPGRAQLIIHPPVPVEGLGESDLADLMARVRSMIAEPLSSFGQAD